MTKVVNYSEKQLEKIYSLAQEAIRLKFDYEQCGLTSITVIGEAQEAGFPELAEELKEELKHKLLFSEGFIQDILDRSKQRRDADEAAEMSNRAVEEFNYEQFNIRREQEAERL